MSALLLELNLRRNLTTRLIHTGQHQIEEMSDIFFEELNLPMPDECFHVQSTGRDDFITGLARRLRRSFTNMRPELVLVVGDVNSTVAAAMAAFTMGIPIAHVEAGLRSFDRQMPEEINRIVTDAFSELLFVSEPSGAENLLSEGFAPSRIHFVGNTLIDTLLRFQAAAGQSPILSQLGLGPRSYVLVTLHRPSNVDSASKLAQLMDMLGRLGELVPVIFPVHPRTMQQIRLLGISTRNLILTRPMGYIAFLRLMSDARLVITDSGGIQEETTYLKVPCYTMRENTERPITISMGSNTLVGVDPERVLSIVSDALLVSRRDNDIPEHWDGHAAKRIVDIIEQRFLE